MTVRRLRCATKMNENDAPQNYLVEEVLREVYALLELYGPSFYNEDIREQIQTVLSHSQYARI